MGSLIGFFAAFDRGDLIDAALVAAALELGGEEGLDDRPRLIGREAPSGEREHIGVVVPAAHLGLLGVVRVHGTNPVDLVGHDRDADPGAADDHCPLGLALGDHSRGVRGVPRVVRGLLGVRADVHDLVAAFFEKRPDELLELESGVVGSDGDLHAPDDNGCPRYLRPQIPSRYGERRP